jgi:hypothetical protein
MFNLETAITEWRRQMRAAGLQSSLQLTELENHLREEIGQGMKSGLNPQNSFEVAVQEMGKADMLKNEFKKVSGISTWLERLRIAICLAFIALITFLGGATVVLCYTSLSDRLMAVIAMTSTVVVACSWRHAVPYLPLITVTWKRVAIGISCIASGFLLAAFFCNVILPHFEGGPNRWIPAIGLWMPFIIAVFACLGMGLCLSEKDREIYGMTRREIPAAA